MFNKKDKNNFGIAKKDLLILSAFYFIIISTAFALFLFRGNAYQKSSTPTSIITPTTNHNTSLNDSKNLELASSKKIVITFDDAWASQYDAYKIMNGLKGVLYINSAFIDKKDRLKMTQLREMYDNGWDVCNHTVHHVNLTKVNEIKAFDEIYGCSSWICGNGFTRDKCYKHFAYPEGAYNDKIINILKKQDFLTARTVNPGNNTSNLLEIGRTSFYGMSIKDIKNKIMSDEDLLILCFHRIVPDNTKKLTQIEMKKSMFQEVVKIINASGRKVITITELYKLISPSQN